MGAIAALLLGAAAFAAEPSFPPLTGRVVDEAGILSTAMRDALTALLAQHEQQTRQQVVVVTLKSLQGDSIEDYGYRLGRLWASARRAATPARSSSSRPASARSASRSATDRWIAAWLYPEAKLRDTFVISEQAQQTPQVKF